MGAVARRYDLEIDFDTAVFGGERKLELPRLAGCTACNGLGTTALRSGINRRGRTHSMVSYYSRPLVDSGSIPLSALRHRKPPGRPRVSRLLSVVLLEFSPS